MESYSYTPKHCCSKAVKPKPKHRIPILVLLILAISFCGTNMMAQGKASRISLFEHLENNEVHTLELHTHLDSLLSYRQTYRYQPADLKFAFANGDVLEESIQLRARGRFRNRFCEIPPLKIKIRKKKLKKRGFKPLNELKLVLPFGSTKRNVNWLYKEYLAYKLYEEITPYAFRAQLVEVIIKDIKGKKEDIRMQAFLVEDKEEVADRLGLEPTDVNVQGRDLQLQQYQTFQFFQFMIGNTDWLPTTGHNMSFFTNAKGEVIPVPYDFDFSGLVGTTYSCPNDRLPITSVKQRYFMGNYPSLGKLSTTIDHFQSKQADLLQIIQDFERLPKGEKNKMDKYLSSFFKLLSDRKKAEANLVHLIKGPRGDHY